MIKTTLIQDEYIKYLEDLLSRTQAQLNKQYKMNASLVEQLFQLKEENETLRTT